MTSAILAKILEDDKPETTFKPKPSKPIYRWKPSGTTETIENELGVVYLCGQCSAIAYAGKSGHKRWYYRFQNEERRQQAIKEFFSGLAARRKMMEDRKADRMKPHSLKVGDILYSSWGYDQTNVDYYEVVAVRGKVVDIRELAQNRTETGFMQGECTPRPGHYISDVIKNKRPDSRNTIHVTSCQWAWPWDGKSNHWTAYA